MRGKRKFKQTVPQEEQPPVLPAGGAPVQPIEELPLSVELKKDPIIKAILRLPLKRIGAFLAISAVVVFAAIVRINTFWLPHWVGDQCHYICLAMKLDKLGLDYFNLRGIKIGFINVNNNKDVMLVVPGLEDDVNSKGKILMGLEKAGITYYDQPLFHKPTGLPWLIMWSHRFFAVDKELYTVVFTNIRDAVYRIKPRVFLLAQFYLAVIPFAFSIGLIIMTYFLGRFLFSHIVGLYAALIIAIHPVDIMSSQKIWADDMVSFFVSAALLLFVLGLKYKRLWMFFFSGMLCGWGVLGKQTAGLFIFGVIFYLLIAHFRDLLSKEWRFKIAGSFFSMCFLGLGLALVTGFWFIKMYQVYGNPIYLPIQGDIAKADISGWFQLLESRPKGMFLYPIGMVYYCPIFIFMFASLKDFVVAVFRALARKTYDYRFIIIWSVALAFYYKLRLDREDRLFLPAYSPLAVMAGYYIYLFREHMAKSRLLKNRVVRELIILLAFYICALWGVPIGMKTAIMETTILKWPF